MSALLRSETRKVFTVRLWWALLLSSLALTALSVAAQIASVNQRGGGGAAQLTTASTQHAIFASGASGGIFALIVGVVIITTEYRHFTSRPTFLVEPRRVRVIEAKIVVSAAVGLLYAVASAALTVAVAVPWLAARNVSIGWSSNDIVQVLLADCAVVAIYAVVGLGVGVLVQSQVAAIIGSLAYLFVLEPLTQIIPVVQNAYRFLPGAAARALTQVGPRSSSGPDLLGAWQGGLLLLGWGLLFAALGAVLTTRRDVQ